ncbi:MAG: hypothetical protein FWH41_06680 [Treponema sp.]|nr:hypothetical protein [Treponema sp.]
MNCYCGNCKHIRGSGDLHYCEKHKEHGINADLYEGGEGIMRCNACIEQLLQENRHNSIEK